jgi:hypothetical protein
LAVGQRYLMNVTPILTPDERRELIEDGRFKEEGLPRANAVKPFDVMEYQSASGFKSLSEKLVNLAHDQATSHNQTSACPHAE